MGQTISDDGITIGIGNADVGIFQKIAYTVYQRVMVNHIGKVGIADTNSIRHLHLLCLLKIRCTRETQHTVKTTTRCPL